MTEAILLGSNAEQGMGACRQLVTAHAVSYWLAGKRLLGPLNFQLSAGKWLFLKGGNGAGKSTLLHLTAGLPHADGQLEGRLSVGTRRVGMVFQQPRLFPWLTVQENVALGLRSMHWSRAEEELRVSSLLSELGLCERASDRTSELSGGLQQRVAIARAVAARPELLLLDEPFSAQDAGAVSWLASWLGAEAHNANAAVILASHVDAAHLHPCDATLELSEPAPAAP